MTPEERVENALGELDRYLTEYGYCKSGLPMDDDAAVRTMGEPFVADIRAAVAEERERCAKLAKEVWELHDMKDGRFIAAVIREAAVTPPAAGPAAAPSS